MAKAKYVFKYHFELSIVELQRNTGLQMSETRAQSTLTGGLMVSWPALL